jgi:GH25 family lysozyme M1 (1,4-beta-N-acetylmuramidase)
MHIGFKQGLVALAAASAVAGLGTQNAVASPIHSPTHGPAASPAQTGVQGIDVSKGSGAINWRTVYAKGIRFAYIRATYGARGKNWLDPRFKANFQGATRAGLVRGAYHYARPNQSSGADQAKRFLFVSGGLPKTTRILPGALDMEGSSDCYGTLHHPARMRAWINDFIGTYRHITRRYPVVYTSKGWWNRCVGTWRPAGSPLWVASWRRDRPTMPAGWGTWTFWQYDHDVPLAGVAGKVDRDKWYGSLRQLYVYADNR